MNPEENDAMRLLDARLAKLHAGLDTRPSFEARLAAHIATLAAEQADSRRDDYRRQVEADYARERAEAKRQARLDTAVLGIAGIGACLAAWRFGPSLWQALQPALAHAGPGMLDLASLPLAAGIVWAVTRLYGMDLRRLAATLGGPRL